MNSVMKQTTQAALFLKGVCRTASHMAIGLVMLGGVILGCAKENRGDGLLKTLEKGDAAAVEKALSALTSEQLDGITKNNAAPGGNFTYDLTKDGKGIVIKKYTGPAVSVLVIPAEIEGYSVVQVGSGDDGYVLYNDISLRELMDNEDTERIRDWKSLVSVVLPATVTEIRRGVFAYSGIKNIVLPQGLKLIGDGAFMEANMLETLVLPDSIEEIGDAAFINCTELFTLTIPDSVKSITFKDNDHFSGCGKLPLATRQRLKDLGYTGEF